MNSLTRFGQAYWFTSIKREHNLLDMRLLQHTPEGHLYVQYFQVVIR